MTTEQTLKKALDKANKELEEVFQNKCDAAENLIRAAEKGYGKDAFAKAVQYLLLARNGANEFYDRVCREFDCRSWNAMWEGSEAYKGFVNLVFERATAKDGKPKTTFYYIPIVQRKGVRPGDRVTYCLRRPKFRPLSVDNQTGRVNREQYDICDRNAEFFLEAAKALPTRLLRIVGDQVNYNVGDTIRELEGIVEDARDWK